MDDRYVFLSDRMLLKRYSQYLIHAAGAGQHRHAGSVTIQTMEERQRAKPGYRQTRVGWARLGATALRPASRPACRQQPGRRRREQPRLLKVREGRRFGSRRLVNADAIAVANQAKMPTIPCGRSPGPAARLSAAAPPAVPTSGNRRRRWPSRVGSGHPDRLTTMAVSCFGVSEHLGDGRTKIIHVVLGHAGDADAPRADNVDGITLAQRLDLVAVETGEREHAALARNKGESRGQRPCPAVSPQTGGASC